MSVKRLLTTGETAAAAAIFGDSVDYARVRVHGRRYFPGQHRRTAVTPNGELYFPPGVYRRDFSGDVDGTFWFIHEMTHVWQYQHGVAVRWLGFWRGVCNRPYDYGSLAGSDADFASFNLEQQASIVADYYLVEAGRRTVHGSGVRGDYERVIPFLPRRR